MSSSSAFIGPGDYVYVCPACKYVEEDVSKLRINTGVGATIMLCCAKCTLFTEVKPVSRSEYFSTGSTMASPLPLKLSPTRERTPSPVPPSIALVNKKEEIADDEMSDTAGNQAVDIPISTTLSSKTEEVLVSIKNLFLDYRIASSRAVDKTIFVEYFDYEALSEIEPSSAVPHIAIGSVHEEPTYSRSVDLIDDYKNEVSADRDDKPVHGMASSPSQPKITLAPANSLAAGRPISGAVATYLAATKANTRASSSQQPQDDTLELLGEEAGNQVTNFKSYYTPQPAKILQFGIRRVAIKLGRSLHFMFENALL